MSNARAMPSERNAYDHRLRHLVCRTRDLDLAERLGVPRSTAKTWLRRGPPSVVTIGVFDDDADRLRERVLRLERRVEVLLALVRLLFVLVRMAGLRLGSKRLPDAEQKQQILDGIARATRIVPRGVALRVVGLRPSRYHSWRQKAPCHLDDRTSCPKARPTQLASNGAHAMRDMVTNLAFRQFSIRALALHAQRITGDAPTVACYSGVENANSKVDTLIDTGRLRRVLQRPDSGRGILRNGDRLGGRAGGATSRGESRTGRHESWH